MLPGLYDSDDQAVLVFTNRGNVIKFIELLMRLPRVQVQLQRYQFRISGNVVACFMLTFATIFQQ